MNLLSKCFFIYWENVNWDKFGNKANFKIMGTFFETRRPWSMGRKFWQNCHKLIILTTVEYFQYDFIISFH